MARPKKTVQKTENGLQVNPDAVFNDEELDKVEQEEILDVDQEQEKPNETGGIIKREPPRVSQKSATEVLVMSAYGMDIEIKGAPKGDGTRNRYTIPGTGQNFLDRNSVLGSSTYGKPVPVLASDWEWYKEAYKHSAGIKTKAIAPAFDDYSAKAFADERSDFRTGAQPIKDSEVSTRTKGVQKHKK